MLRIRGYTGALLELTLFFAAAYSCHTAQLQKMDTVSYYWFCFSVLTGIWEFFYLSNYQTVARYAQQLQIRHRYVWFMQYDLSMIMPWTFSKLFYAEYAAHADREYKSRTADDYWSRLVESSHALFCALNCLLSLVALQRGSEHVSLCFALFGMGAQFMNSLLYMGEYFLQCLDVNSVNHISNSFPFGPWMCRRLFMWVNALWLIFPVYALLAALCRVSTAH